MIEGLAKAMSEAKEQTAETKESIIPDFIKKELAREQKDDDPTPIVETTGPLASKEKDGTDTHLPETNGTVAFKGEMKDESNYNYYMDEARGHKESAESDENWARQKFDWAKSYTDSDPSKTQSYISEGNNWQSKADSEWSAYRDALAKADSYK
jgi:hypothetical protein